MKFFKLMANKEQAYSLIELSIVLLIISILAGGAITTAATSIELAKEKQTQNKIKILDDAISSFLAINHRLPCPALGNLAANNANYGVENCGIAISNNGGNVDAGVVPIRTLQLPENFITDGWGKKITYVADRRLYTTNTMLLFSDNDDVSPPTFNIASDGIDIFNDSANSIALRTAYVLISHGKNGHGAWLNTETAAATIFDSGSTDASENENANAVGNINNRFIMKARDANYDDIIFFRNKNQIIRKANYVFAGQECQQAINVINYVGVNRGAEELCSASVEADTCVQLLSTLTHIINQLCIVKQ